MKKLIYLIVLILVLGLIVAGCDNPVVPPAEQSELDNQTKDVVDTTITVILKDSQGGFVQGGKVYLGVGGWPYKGETNTEGVLTFAYSGGASMRVKVIAPNYGGTQTSLSQDLSTEPGRTFTFQTEVGVNPSNWTHLEKNKTCCIIKKQARGTKEGYK